MRTIEKESHISDDDILIKLNSCSICGYDIRVFKYGNKKVRSPITLGHEICGQTTSEIRLENGEVIPSESKVAICPVIPCLKCQYCELKQYNLCNNLNELGSSIDGGFAEYLILPKNSVKINGIIPVSENISNEETALLEPLACCINGLRFYNKKNVNTTVIIVGDGPIGLLYLQLFKSFNVSVILVGKIPLRLERAKQIGATEVVYFDTLSTTKEIINNLTNGKGSEFIILATSNREAFELSKSIIRKNGIILLFAGIDESSIYYFDPNWIHYNQIVLYGSFSSTPQNIRDALRMVIEKQVNVSQLITNSFQLNDIVKAFESAGKYNGIKTMITNFN